MGGSSVRDAPAGVVRSLFGPPPPLRAPFHCPPASGREAMVRHLRAYPCTMRESWASSEANRRSMRGNKGRDTQPELAVRRLLHARGLRYRVNYRLERDLRRTGRARSPPTAPVTPRPARS
ncbi:hypothetical protein [Citricoccus nitrophenolicus]|uniref:hypothetical protein n=1 Tax=Citricoccus nitrophenolicus TaxID=863575 RepID=UPI0039B6BFEF